MQALENPELFENLQDEFVETAVYDEDEEPPELEYDGREEEEEYEEEEYEDEEEEYDDDDPIQHHRRERNDMEKVFDARFEKVIILAIT